MSGAAHTPGPWRTSYRSMFVMADNAKIGGDTPVCEIRGWGYLTGCGHGALNLSPEEGARIQEANARLISAAPEMLAALKLARDACGANAARDAVDAAIAKAEGRQP